DPPPEQRLKPVCPSKGHPDLEDAVPVVLGAELTDAAHAAKGELEPVPIVGRRQRCDHEVDLARTRGRARRRDRLRPRRVLIGQRLLDEIALLAILARRQEARSRLRGDRRVVTGRRWGRDLLARRRRWRWLLGLGAAGSDACREVHDLLVVLALLLVVACHGAQRTAQAQVNAATIARIERATADAIARVRRRGSRAGVVRRASIAARSSGGAAPIVACGTPRRPFGRVMPRILPRLAAVVYADARTRGAGEGKYGGSVTACPTSLSARARPATSSARSPTASASSPSVSPPSKPSSTPPASGSPSTRNSTPPFARRSRGRSARRTRSETAPSAPPIRSSSRRARSAVSF